MPESNKAYLLLGSNIEPRFDFMKEALELIGETVGRVVRISSVYESEPWGFQSKVHFLNCVVLVESRLMAEEILRQILNIEKRLGRVRRKGVGYASRKIDIDMLYFNEDVIDMPDLQVPHPRLHERRFTLMPLVEIVPELVHPKLRKTNRELLEQLDDLSEIMIYKGTLLGNEV